MCIRDRVSADRIFSLLDEKNQEDPFEGDWSQPIIGKVEFRDVWFAYDADNWILKGVSSVSYTHLDVYKRQGFINAYLKASSLGQLQK